MAGTTTNEFACTSFSKEPLKMNRHWMGGSRSKVAQDRAKSIEVKQRAFFEAQKRGHNNTPFRVASAPDDTLSPHLSRDFTVLTTNIDCATPVNTGHPQNQSAKKRKERDSPDQKAPEVQQPQPLKLQSGHLMSASTAQSSPLQRIKERCDDFKKPKRLQAARTPTLHASVPIPSPVVGHKRTERTEEQYQQAESWLLLDTNEAHLKRHTPRDLNVKDLCWMRNPFTQFGIEPLGMPKSHPDMADFTREP